MNSTPAHAAGPCQPGLDDVVALRDRLRHDADARAFLLDPAPVRGRDQSALQRIAVHPDHLGHLGAVRRARRRRPRGATAPCRPPGPRPRRVPPGCVPGPVSVRRSTTSPRTVAASAALAASAACSRAVAIRAGWSRHTRTTCPAATRTPAPRSSAGRELLDLAVVEPDRGVGASPRRRPPRTNRPAGGRHAGSLPRVNGRA